jgi:hypothetical protein
VFRLDTGGTHTDIAIQFAAADTSAPEPGTIELMLSGGVLLLVGSIRRGKGASA